MSHAPARLEKVKLPKYGCGPCLSRSFPLGSCASASRATASSEERRVYVKCDVCPVRFHLGEQAEVLIQVAILEKATLVPEIAVTGFDGRKGTVWTVEDGRLARRAVSFGHRTQDARLQIVGGLPDGAVVVAEIGATLQEGRSARTLAETKR